MCPHRPLLVNNTCLIFFIVACVGLHARTRKHIRTETHARASERMSQTGRGRGSTQPNQHRKKNSLFHLCLYVCSCNAACNMTSHNSERILILCCCDWGDDGASNFVCANQTSQKRVDCLLEPSRVCVCVLTYFQNNPLSLCTSTRSP